MRKVLALALFFAAGIAGIAGADQPAAMQAKPAARDSHDLSRYKLAITDARRKLFAAGMSNLTPEQLQTFWAVYGDYEKEKNAITAARTDLAKKYVEAYAS